MAKVSLESLKALVVHKWMPLVVDIKNWMDSFRHKDDAIAISEVTNLQNQLNILSAGIIGQTPIKRIIADYNVEVTDSVIAIGYNPEVEGPTITPNINVTLLDPFVVPNRDFCFKRYCSVNVGTFKIIPASGKIQDPFTGTFESEYNLPPWGAPGSCQRWKSDGVNYQAI